MISTIALLLVAPPSPYLVDSKPVQDAIDSSRAVWYGEDGQTYQRAGHVELAFEASSVNPNRFNPWRHPGGVGARATDRVTSSRFVFIPPGSAIVLWRGEDGRIKWIYPRGSIVGEFLSEKDRTPFELRIRRRLADDWQFQVFRPEKSGRFVEDNFEAPTPENYETPTDCRRCHQDAGRDARTLDDRRAGSWRGVVRGSDGVFSVPILDPPKLGFRRLPAINPELKQIVRIRKPGEPIRGRVPWTNLKE